MRRKSFSDSPPLSSEITSFSAYVDRRRLMAAAVGGVAALARPRAARAEDEALTPKKDVISYNNFYEFGVEKSDPVAYAGALDVKGWRVRIDGLVGKPADYLLEDFLKPLHMEDRVYRLRCVEGWSMVIPWRGVPLAAILARAEPLASARYVAFESLVRPAQMAGQRAIPQILDWPYREGLRLDEAMHPLAFLATGLYGEDLPNQNGAPLRLVTPWKYGFKSIKSIVRITLTDKQPTTTWNQNQPHEYGFYANVNPTVDHPRWSQASERPIRSGSGFFTPRRKTLLFNGYDSVAALYSGMDLRTNF